MMSTLSAPGGSLSGSQIRTVLKSPRVPCPSGGAASVSGPTRTSCSTPPASGVLPTRVRRATSPAGGACSRRGGSGEGAARAGTASTLARSLDGRNLGGLGLRLDCRRHEEAGSSQRRPARCGVQAGACGRTLGLRATARASSAAGQGAHARISDAKRRHAKRSGTRQRCDTQIIVSRGRCLSRRAICGATLSTRAGRCANTRRLRYGLGISGDGSFSQRHASCPSAQAAPHVSQASDVLRYRLACTRTG
jgi:hypothetical protein